MSAGWTALSCEVSQIYRRSLDQGVTGVALRLLHVKGPGRSSHFALQKPLGPPIGLSPVAMQLKEFSVSSILNESAAVTTTARDLPELDAQSHALGRSQDTNRAVNVATGLLMGRQNLTQRAAFECLRQYARAHRQRIDEVAAELIRTHDEAGLLLAALSGFPNNKDRRDPVSASSRPLPMRAR